MRYSPAFAHARSPSFTGPASVGGRDKLSSDTKLFPGPGRGSNGPHELSALLVIPPPNVTSAPKRVRNYISQAALGGASAFSRSGKGLAPRLSRSRRLSDPPPRSLPGSFRFLRRTGAWSRAVCAVGSPGAGAGAARWAGGASVPGSHLPRPRPAPPRSDRPLAHTWTWPGLLLPPPRDLPPPAPVCNVLPSPRVTR